MRHSAATWRFAPSLSRRSSCWYLRCSAKNCLRALHIELNSFRIAGGIMLFLIAIDMVFEKRTERREERAAENHRHARDRGCLRLPDGHADDRRAGVNRVGHAADGAE